MLIAISFVLCCTFGIAKAVTRTTPPAGAVVVRLGTVTDGEFADIGSAINSLPNDSSAQTVFIFPGIYEGQVNISRPGPLIVSFHVGNPKHYSG